MKVFALIVLLLLTTTLGDAARIFGFTPLYVKSDSHVKPDSASSYASVGERTSEKAVLEHNERPSRREGVTKHPGSESKLKPSVSTNFNNSNVRSGEPVQQILRSVKFDTVEPQMKKTVARFQPLDHSPGIGHDDPRGLKH